MIFGILGITLSAVFAALRVMAVTNSNKLLTSLTLALGLVPVDATASRACAIISDAIVVILVWYYAFDSGELSIRNISGVKFTLAKLLLRDGIFYFIVRFFLLLADTILHWVDYGFPDITVFLTPFVLTLVFRLAFLLILNIISVCAILLHRFLLHLRAAVSTDVWIGSRPPSCIHTEEFLQIESNTLVMSFASPMQDENEEDVEGPSYHADNLPLPTVSSGGI
ncbi:uncharacterized protein FIBRA_01315 [Fibroporia radiculosa]|uniref:Uncharacterized protein n=1 Tax=Fibroporia radiculosa TaxID=599839 RepID=J4H113_9APHY|nr:uncharacterized protein FIBRA_01315 [Fibroporia radiculosa]CCL99299.1 predicted protein [Fibroporia radiculosa]